MNPRCQSSIFSSGMSSHILHQLVHSFKCHYETGITRRLSVTNPKLYIFENKNIYSVNALRVLRISYLWNIIFICYFPVSCALYTYIYIYIYLNIHVFVLVMIVLKMVNLSLFYCFAVNLVWVYITLFIFASLNNTTQSEMLIIWTIL